MKEKIKTFFCVLFLACSLPYIITLCLQGKEGQPNIVQNNASEKTDTKQDGKEEKESDAEAMGREDLDVTWEKTNRTEALREAVENMQ